MKKSELQQLIKEEINNIMNGEFPATTAKRELEKLRSEIEAIVNNTELVTKDEKEKAYNELLDREGYSEDVKQYMRRAISGALFRQNLNK